MQFTSIAFLLFAALTLFFYFALPKKMQWGVLLAASYVFYLFAGARYLFFIAYTTLVTYLIARWLQARADAEDAYVAAHRETMEKTERKAYRAREKKKRFRILTVGLFLGFGLLAVLKYTAFALSGVNAVLALFSPAKVAVPSLLLPLGMPLSYSTRLCLAPFSKYVL